MALQQKIAVGKMCMNHQSIITQLTKKHSTKRLVMQKSANWYNRYLIGNRSDLASSAAYPVYVTRGTLATIATKRSFSLASLCLHASSERFTSCFWTLFLENTARLLKGYVLLEPQNAVLPRTSIHFSLQVKDYVQ